MHSHPSTTPGGKSFEASCSSKPHTEPAIRDPRSALTQHPKQSHPYHCPQSLRKNKAPFPYLILTLFTRITFTSRTKQKQNRSFLFRLPSHLSRSQIVTAKKTNPAIPNSFLIPQRPLKARESPKGSLTDRLKAHFTEGDVFKIRRKKPGRCPASDVLWRCVKLAHRGKLMDWRAHIERPAGDLVLSINLIADQEHVYPEAQA